MALFSLNPSVEAQAKMASAMDFPKATDRESTSAFSPLKPAYSAFSSESIAARSVASRLAVVKKLRLISARVALTLAGQLYFLNGSVSGNPESPLYLCFQESNPGSTDSYALIPE